MITRSLRIGMVVGCCLLGPLEVQAQATRKDPLTLGNPSGATTANPNNYLMVKPQYTLSYSNRTRTPNWVSWHLSSAWLGTAPRQNNFRPDPSLPAGWYRVTSASYNGGGFDRGHMCDSADRTASVADNSATFLMTNIVPQAPASNRGPWAHLEEYCRSLATHGMEMYITAGPAGSGGTGSAGARTSIDAGRVNVPSQTWKVILVLPNGTNDLRRITTSTRVIAVSMPNNQTVGQNWGVYRTSVRAIESLTGYNFFTNVPAATRNVLKARVDNGPTR